MPSCNQLKVSRSVRDDDRGVIGAEVLVEREESLWVHRCNQQKTYDNKTGEHTSGQGPIFIQDWQMHLWNKEYRADEWIRDVRVCAQACKRRKMKRTMNKS